MNTNVEMNLEANAVTRNVLVELDFQTGEIVITRITERTRVVVEHEVETEETILPGLGAAISPLRQQFAPGTEMSRFNGAAID